MDGGGAQPGSLSSCFYNKFLTQLAICLSEMNVFEMDASATKSLMSGTYITIKKFNIRHLHHTCSEYVVRH